MADLEVLAPVRAQARVDAPVAGRLHDVRERRNVGADLAFVPLLGPDEDAAPAVVAHPLVPRRRQQPDPERERDRGRRDGIARDALLREAREAACRSRPSETPARRIPERWTPI